MCVTVLPRYKKMILVPISGLALIFSSFYIFVKKSPTLVKPSLLSGLCCGGSQCVAGKSSVVLREGRKGEDMSERDKSGVWLFGVTAVACWVVTALLKRRQEQEDDQGEGSQCSDDSEDSLDDYFRDDVDYSIRDDYALNDGRFKMVLVVNMKLG